MSNLIELKTHTYIYIYNSKYYRFAIEYQSIYIMFIIGYNKFANVCFCQSSYHLVIQLSIAGKGKGLELGDGGFDGEEGESDDTGEHAWG